MSDDQRKTALRVANVPAEEFEAAVESADPPTVTELATIDESATSRKQSRRRPFERARSQVVTQSSGACLRS